MKVNGMMAVAALLFGFATSSLYASDTTRNKIAPSAASTLIEGNRTNLAVKNLNSSYVRTPENRTSSIPALSASSNSTNRAVNKLSNDRNVSRRLTNSSQEKGMSQLSKTTSRDNKASIMMLNKFYGPGIR